MKAEGVFLRSGLKVTCAPNFCSLLCQLYFHLGLEVGQGLLLTWLFVMGLPAPHFFSGVEATESSSLRFVICFCFLTFLCFLCVFCDRTRSILSPRVIGIHWPGQVSFFSDLSILPFFSAQWPTLENRVSPLSAIWTTITFWFFLAAKSWPVLADTGFSLWPPYWYIIPGKLLGHTMPILGMLF